MPEQRYERVTEQDESDATTPAPAFGIPDSPPPSFRSRASSPAAASRRLLSDDPLADDTDRTLADAFDSPDDGGDSDSENGDGLDDRQRLMRGQPEPAPPAADESHETERPSQGVQRRVTQLPVFRPQPTATARPGQVYGGGQNDGVFANLSAKPTKGEVLEEKPPTYEQAAADAAPPYWETTILTPGFTGDEVFIDGLAVGSVFSFVWNAMISMSFQLVGFLLTYLLHTTHAAKNGSRAGLGITLVQYGFTMKSSSNLTPADVPNDFGGGVPDDPNSHDFDPTTVAPTGDAMPATGGVSSSDWLAYGLMIVGWFILIKSISDFVRARRHEQLVLQSPDRGLGVPIVAEGESPERSV